MNDLNPIQWAFRPFKRYADFRGRSPRAEYWWYILIVGVAGFLLGLVDVMVLNSQVYGNYGPLGLAFTFAVIIPGLAVLVRRLHDTDRSGWWAAVKIPTYGFILTGGSPIQTVTSMEAVVPMPVLAVVVLGWIVAGFAVFLFTVTEGYGGPNDYGPDPYGADELEEVFA